MKEIFIPNPKQVKEDDTLSDYILVIDDAIEKKTLKQTLKKIKDIEWGKEIPFDFPHSDFDSRYTTVFDLEGADFYTSQFNVLETRNTSEITLPFEKIIYDCLLTYSFKFYDFGWYRKWYNFTQARFNKYSKGMYMGKHCDHFRTMFDGRWKGVPVYSVIGFLNDNYEGGDLVFWDDTVIEKQAGMVVVFPSNFLYPHKITPVTKGTKYSFVSYAF
jgi:hypothetical protein